MNIISKRIECENTELIFNSGYYSHLRIVRVFICTYVNSLNATILIYKQVFCFIFIYNNRRNGSMMLQKINTTSIQKYRKLIKNKFIFLFAVTAPHGMPSSPSALLT